ncbi:CAP domain-containing protein [Paenibacillus sp. P26]|nr:CAP domain-containing protein [Paenibacillus sp. P26]UUZ96538.1 CAP domain-containing protein [Paenibacillus sp. P25]
MNKWMGFALVVLLTGCAGNQGISDRRMDTQQAKTGTHANQAGQASPARIYKKASSISTKGEKQETIKIQEAPGDALNGLEQLIPNFDFTTTQPTQPSQPAQPAQPSGNPPQAAGSSDFAQQVLNLVNQERSKAGLSALTMNAKLSNVAMMKAKDMFNNHYFDHQSPTYGSPFDMMNANGISFSYAGENIAQGQTSPAEVMNQWMNSPGHRANILNQSYTQIGIAYYNGEWVQEFIG